MTQPNFAKLTHLVSEQLTQWKPRSQQQQVAKNLIRMMARDAQQEIARLSGQRPANPATPIITTEMKAQFMGEFYWDEEAPYYDADGELNEDHVARRVVPWDLCKQIYKDMTLFASEQAAQGVEPIQITQADKVACILSFEMALKYARHAAWVFGAFGDHKYLPRNSDQAKSFHPHAWVTEAIRSAFEDGQAFAQGWDNSRMRAYGLKPMEGDTAPPAPADVATPCDASHFYPAAPAGRQWRKLVAGEWCEFCSGKWLPLDHPMEHQYLQIERGQEMAAFAASTHLNACERTSIETGIGGALAQTMIKRSETTQ